MYSSSYKRYITVLLLAIYIINQVDRGVFGILMEPIKREFALTDTQLGFLAGPALALFYAILGVPIARWADRSHRINIMTGAITVWSCIVALSAAVGNFWHFALARIGVGIGEAGFSAVAQSVIADYHTRAERTRALSIFMLALPLSGVVANLMGGWVNEVYGWRMVFIVAGLPGLLLAVVLKLTVREPPRSITPTAAGTEGHHPSLAFVFATLWGRPALRHTAIGMTLLTFISGGVLGWSGPFFMRIHSMPTGELGTWGAFIALGGAAGVWASGRFKIENQRTQARVLAASALITWPLMVAMLIFPAKVGALLLYLVALFAVNFFFAPSFSLVQSLCAANMRATMVAIVIFFQLLFAGVIGVQLIGIVSDAFTARVGGEAVRWAMLVLSPVALWAGLHFWLAGRTIQRDLQDVVDASGDSGDEPSALSGPHVAPAARTSET